ncbi:unnamed protein product [Rhodiola kirilowii]
MGRSPCCAKIGLNRGAWTVLEDTTLTDYIQIHGEGKWKQLPKNAGLKRCGKSCRLRWLNYLRPDIKRGNIGEDEAELIVRLHKLLGNRWSLIAGRIPGRTDNEIKNYWNTTLSKKYASSSEMATTPKSQMTKSKSVNAINKMDVRTLGIKSPPLASSSGVFRTRASRPPAFGRSSSDSNIVRNGAMENIGLSCKNDQPSTEGKMQDTSNTMDVDDDGLGLGDFCLSDFINTDLDFLGAVNWEMDVDQYQVGCIDTGQDHNSELFSGFIDSYDNWEVQFS